MNTKHLSSQTSIVKYAVRRIARGVGASTAIITLLMVAGTAAISASSEEATAFHRTLHLAMDRMMSGMDARPTGNIDKDFVTMMEPHHQGAIDMAIAELRYGRNEQLRRIAQEIIIDQQQEIAAMRIAVGRSIPPSVPAPTTGALGEAGTRPMDHGASFK